MGDYYRVRIETKSTTGGPAGSRNRKVVEYGGSSRKARAHLRRVRGRAYFVEGAVEFWLWGASDGAWVNILDKKLSPYSPFSWPEGLPRGAVRGSNLTIGEPRKVVRSRWEEEADGLDLSLELETGVTLMLVS